MMAEILTGEEVVVYGDSGYLGAEKRPEAVTTNQSGKRIHYKINRRPSPEQAQFQSLQRHRSSAESTRNLQYEPKLNMSSLL